VLFDVAVHIVFELGQTLDPGNCPGNGLPGQAASVTAGSVAAPLALLRRQIGHIFRRPSLHGDGR
jgi:hypothetical protein